MELSASWVGVHALAEEFVVLKLVSEERTGPKKKLASHDYNSLTVQELLGYL